MDRSAGTAMAVLRLGDAISSHYGPEITAMRVMPLISPLLICPSLTSPQFAAVVKSLKEMLDRVQEKRGHDVSPVAGGMQGNAVFAGGLSGSTAAGGRGTGFTGGGAESGVSLGAGWQSQQQQQQQQTGGVSALGLNGGLGVNRPSVIGAAAAAGGGSSSWEVGIGSGTPASSSSSRGGGGGGSLAISSGAWNVGGMAGGSTTGHRISSSSSSGTPLGGGRTGVGAGLGNDWLGLGGNGGASGTAAAAPGAGTTWRMDPIVPASGGGGAPAGLQPGMPAPDIFSSGDVGGGLGGLGGISVTAGSRQQQQQGWALGGSQAAALSPRGDGGLFGGLAVQPAGVTTTASSHNAAASLARLGAPPSATTGIGGGRAVGSLGKPGAAPADPFAAMLGGGASSSSNAVAGTVSSSSNGSGFDPFGGQIRGADPFASLAALPGGVLGSAAAAGGIDPFAGLAAVNGDPIRPSRQQQQQQQWGAASNGSLI